MFFHRKSQCSNGNNCKFSHAPLTEETREILDKVSLSECLLNFVTNIEQRVVKKADIVDNEFLNFPKKAKFL